jgi:hypothetical protein
MTVIDRETTEHTAPDFYASTRMVFYAERSASLSLHLDGLPGDLAGRVSVLPPRRLQADLPLLAAAGLVVFVRGFEHVWRSRLLTALQRVGVPCAWFTDDDLTALRGDQPGFAFYTDARVRHFAAQMVAVIGTSPALCVRLASFHTTVLHWPCVLDERLLAPATVHPTVSPNHPPRVACIGGGFRAEGLRRVVLPALDALPGARLLLADPLAAGIPGTQVLPFEPDFPRFVAAWRAAKPDILAHPPGQTANLAMKGPGTLLAALYLGAAPVVAEEPAYTGLGIAQGVLRADNNVAAWRAALAYLAEPDVRQQHLARLLAHFRGVASPEAARATVEALLAHAAPAGAAARQAAALRLGWRPPLSVVWGARLRCLVRLRASRSR